MWLVFALLAPLLFAIVHVVDSYCVDDIYDKPWLGMIVSAIASLIVFLPAPYLLPLIDSSNITLQLVGAAVIAGVIIQINQAIYFEALDHSDASIVTAYWNMIPAFVPLVSFFVFQEQLSVKSYVGIFILVFSSVIFCLLDSTYKSRW